MEPNDDEETKEDFNKCNPHVHVDPRLLLLDNWEKAIKEGVIPEDLET